MDHSYAFVKVGDGTRGHGPFIFDCNRRVEYDESLAQRWADPTRTIGHFDSSKYIIQRDLKPYKVQELDCRGTGSS